MPKYIKPFNNKNKPIVDVGNSTVPLVYFNHVYLKKNQTHTYHLEQYETVVVILKGSLKVEVDDKIFSKVGNRSSLWEGKPESVYAGRDSLVKLTSLEDETEVYIAGGKIEDKFDPFYVSNEEVLKIQYGSDETKTHRKIYHIIGQNNKGQTGRLLVSELFTVGRGGWSGFPPHKHDTDRLPLETCFEEVYQFRFNPVKGFGAQFMYSQDDMIDEVYHVKDRSTILIDKGYHPSVVAPGYLMYYFTIIVGKTQKSLTQYFHPDHSYQLETIPGIKDMIKNFKQ